MTRPTWDEYWLAGAEWTATRAECTRSRVGALLVKRNRLVAQGYNGAPAGESSCLTGACPRSKSTVLPGSSYDTGPGVCISTHAELNVLLFAGSAQQHGATLYVTREPCDGCWKVVKASGVVRVVWPEGEWRR